MEIKKPGNFPAFPRGVNPCMVAEKPDSDDEYFEKMALCIFRTGLNWSVIDKKQQEIIKSFDNFSVIKVSQYDQKDVDRLMANPGIVRNVRKIQAIIDNSREFISIQIDHGSFTAYLEENRKNGDDELVAVISRRFRYLGTSSSVMFLKSVGEELPEITARWMSDTHDP